MRRFVLHFKMAPGDELMLTALVRDLKLAHPEWLVDVAQEGTNFKPHLYRHNPYITSFPHDDPGVEHVKLTYRKSLANVTKNGKHFVSAFHREFEAHTRIHVPVRFPHGDLHLSEEEKANPKISGRYWLVVAGGKADMTVKIWSQARYQAVVDRLRLFGLKFVQEGSVRKPCRHPPLENALNVVGTTSIRDLLVNIYHAEGVICGITFPMHAAAALQRPCVVIAGGREDPCWEEYTNDRLSFGPQCGLVQVPHRFLHTIGLLDCCKTRGCWADRVIRENDRQPQDTNLCKLPVPGENSQIVPKCMDMIQVDHVVEATMWYYEQGYLPPPMASVETRNQWRKDLSRGRNPAPDGRLPAAAH